LPVKDKACSSGNWQPATVFIPQSAFRPALRGVQGSPEPYVVQGEIRN